MDVRFGEVSNDIRKYRQKPFEKILIYEPGKTLYKSQKNPYYMANEIKHEMRSIRF